MVYYCSAPLVWFYSALDTLSRPENELRLELKPMQQRQLERKPHTFNKLFCYNQVRTKCESGGTGRRARLRIWSRKGWGFDSPLSHHSVGFRMEESGITIKEIALC